MGAHRALIFAAASTAGCGPVAARTPAEPGPLPLAQVAPGFWDHWGDGRAEVSSYTLTTPRYGDLRTGSAVLVFVTEDFTDAQRVKSDGGHGDEFPVLKLNEIRHYQTGVYDYKVMTSAFTRIDGAAPLGQATKVSLSMQEWCGHVYEQVTTRDGALDWVGHSYFDGEADHQRALPLPADGVMLDALPVVARGLAGSWSGEVLEVSALESLARMRYAHQPLDWIRAELRRGASERVTVPAGTFDVTGVTLTRDDGLAVTWSIEVAPPHRVIRWSTSDGEVAEMVGSERIPYWSLHGPGDEENLTRLGLRPASSPVVP